MQAHWTTRALIIAAAATACFSPPLRSAKAAPLSIRSDASYLELQETGLATPRGVFIQQGRRCISNLSNCDVIYIADGLSIAFANGAPSTLKRELDSIVMVGLINWRGNDDLSTLRNNELLISRNDPSFFAFEHFLLASVIPAVEHAAKPKGRWIVGGSSGGAWALSVAMRQPHVFSGVLAFSPASWPVPARALHPCPTVFMGWGSNEKYLGAQAIRDASALRTDDCTVQTVTIAGGHDFPTWNSLFWLAISRLRSKY